MKRIIFILICCFCLATVGYAQITQEELDKAYQEMKEAKGRKEKKAKKQAYQALLTSAVAQNAVESLEAQDFVLEGERLNFRSGGWKYVTPSTNFISVENGKAIIQVAFDDSPGPGINGIGGITLEGDVSKVETKTDKKGNIHFLMHVAGKVGSATVDFTLPKNSHKVIATISPNLHRYRFTMEGSLLPASQARVFKARVL